MAGSVQDVKLRLTVLGEIVMNGSLSSVKVHDSHPETGRCCQSCRYQESGVKIDPHLPMI